MFRKATAADIEAIGRIYDAIHTLEEAGQTSIGWVRSIYPTRTTAAEAIALGDMFVLEENGTVTAAARINRIQVPEYCEAAWEYPADDSEVMVLHTLVVDPALERKGRGSSFVRFYEQYAAENGCPYLRMDTNERNLRARAMYSRLGYREVSVVPCSFNGIPGVRLVCLEKKI